MQGGCLAGKIYLPQLKYLVAQLIKETYNYDFLVVKSFDIFVTDDCLAYPKSFIKSFSVRNGKERFKKLLTYLIFKVVSRNLTEKGY